MHGMQCIILAKRFQVCDTYPLPVRINESTICLWESKILSIVVISPAVMTKNSAVGHRNHVGFL